MDHTLQGTGYKAPQEPGIDQATSREPAQVSQWGEIGITAVAAAVRYTAETKPAAEERRIVTLRDIDHLAA